MRTFRLSLCGVILSALLLGMFATASAATNLIPDGSADRVSGELLDPVHVVGPEPAPGLPGVMSNRWQYDVAWDSDIQLPSHVTVTMREDVHFIAGPDRGAVICWGNVAFEDETGYMVGPVRGYVIDGEAQVQARLYGGGAYDGLNAILTGPIGGEGGGTIEGVIFEGYMPRD